MSGLAINIDETKLVEIAAIRDRRLKWEGHFGLDWSHTFTALGIMYLGTQDGPRLDYDPSRQGVVVEGFLRRYNLVATNLLENSKGPLYTFAGCNGQSYIDYIAILEETMTYVGDCYVGEPHPLKNSDHLPVFVSLDVGELTLTTCEYNIPARVKWGRLSSYDRLVKYENKLLPGAEAIIEKLNNTLPSEGLIEWGFSTLTNVIHEVSA